MLPSSLLHLNIELDYPLARSLLASDFAVYLFIWPMKVAIDLSRPFARIVPGVGRTNEACVTVLDRMNSDGRPV